MVQARTLHLQRVVASSPSDDSRIDVNKLLDLAKRLDELEAHVADTTAALVSSTPLGESQSPSSANEREHAQNVAAQAASEVQKTLQPELDALNRAVRRYEKRTTVMAFQIESRLQELETQVGDAITLAAANGHSGFFLTLVAWVRTIIALVVQGILGLASFPIFITSYVLQTLKSFLGIQKWSSQRDRKGKQPRNTSSPSPRRQRRGHSTISAQGLRGLRRSSSRDGMTCLGREPIAPRYLRIRWHDMPFFFHINYCLIIPNSLSNFTLFLFPSQKSLADIFLSKD